jgi:hypothetical protein
MWLCYVSLSAVDTRAASRRVCTSPSSAAGMAPPGDNRVLTHVLLPIVPVPPSLLSALILLPH